MLHCAVSALPCRHIKESSANALAQPYDLATLQEVLGALPSWLAGIGGATEDLAWLNKLLAQVGTDTAVVLHWIGSVSPHIVQHFVGCPVDPTSLPSPPLPRPAARTVWQTHYASVAAVP